MSNPYAAPNADMSSPAMSGATYMPEMFAIHGRIGRVRYLVYAMVLPMLLLVAAGLLAALLALINPMLAMIAMVMYIPALAVTFVVTRRRLNDMDRSGWWGLMHFVPLLNIFFALWLLFGRGNDGTNNFGLPPAPNSTGLLVTAWAVPVVLVLVMASVAVPAYKAYMAKAQAAAIEATASQEAGVDNTDSEPAPAEPAADGAKPANQ